MPTLLLADGPGWKIEIIGKLPDLPPFISAAPQTSIVFDGGVSVEVFDRATGAMRPIASGAPIEPLFFEAVGYDIHFERDDSSAKLSLPLGSEARRKRPDSEHHTLNFGNNVGFADITASTDTHRAKLRVEVFSRKADYRTDYVAMRDEVSGMLRNLAMAANARTYGLAAPAKDHNPSLEDLRAVVADDLHTWQSFDVALAEFEAELLLAEHYGAHLTLQHLTKAVAFHRLHHDFLGLDGAGTCRCVRRCLNDTKVREALIRLAVLDEVSDDLEIVSGAPRANAPVQERWDALETKLSWIN